jgi:hypothetical protein
LEAAGAGKVLILLGFFCGAAGILPENGWLLRKNN